MYFHEKAFPSLDVNALDKKSSKTNSEFQDSMKKCFNENR